MSLVNGDTPGTIYLLHFDPPYRHAKHYLGWTNREQVRYKAHLNGKGSRLVAAAVAAGSQITVVWTRPGTRRDEAALKRGHDSVRLCPICGPERRQRKRDALRRMRARRRAWRPLSAWTLGAAELRRDQRRRRALSG